MIQKIPKWKTRRDGVRQRYNYGKSSSPRIKLDYCEYCKKNTKHEK